jgi:hypothetical protein
MDEQPTTCGQGLAANAPLPELIGELFGAMAEVLEDHRQALDVNDPDAQPEHDAYARLVGDLRAIATQAGAISRQLTGYRNLPMGAHDEARMSAPEAWDVFDRFVTVERHLLQWLSTSVAAHEEMLRMRQ